MISLPTAVTLILCDYVIVEAKTQKVSLIGTFTNLAVRQFPGRANPFSAHAVLTDGFGDVTIQLVASRLDTGEEVYTQQNLIYFPNRLTEVIYHTRLHTFRFPVAGHYQFSLYANGEWVAHRRLHAKLKQEES